MTSITDKAKPRVIVGRKATGPFGIAELPKQKNFMIPVVYIDHGFFILVKRSTDYKSHRSALKKYMEGGRAR